MIKSVFKEFEEYFIRKSLKPIDQHIPLFENLLLQRQKHVALGRKKSQWKKKTLHTHLHAGNILDCGMMEQLLYISQELGCTVPVAQRASDWYDSLMFSRFLSLDFLSKTTLQTALKKALKNRAGRLSFLKTHFLLGLFFPTLIPLL